MKIITSVNNSQVKAWSKLNTKKGRLKQGKYLLDGWHLVKEAIRTHEPIETIMVQPDFKHLQEIEVPEDADLIQITDNVVKHFLQMLKIRLNHDRFDRFMRPNRFLN